VQLFYVTTVQTELILYRSPLGGRGEPDLVSRCKFGPGFVRTPVIVLSMSALHILMKAQDLSGLELSDRGPLWQLQMYRHNIYFHIMHVTETLSP